MCLRMFVCVHLLVYMRPFMRLGVIRWCCYLMCVSGDWTATSLACGVMAIIMTIQRTAIGSIKMSWLSAEQTSVSSVQADACDKIMIRPLSGFHIDQLTTDYRRRYLVCVPSGRWSDSDDRSVKGPLEQWGLQEEWAGRVSHVKCTCLTALGCR